MESMCPALADGFLPTVPLGKNRKCRILRDFFFFFKLLENTASKW